MRLAGLGLALHTACLAQQTSAPQATGQNEVQSGKMPVADSQASSASGTKQLPKTAPATEQILSSYEGQNVTSIEVVGRPNEDTNQYQQMFLQQAGEPFAKDKVDQTVAALKASGKFKEIELQVEPEANGVRILLVPGSAIYFGIFQFPGAERFPYSKLIQIASFPPEAPYNSVDIREDQQALLTFFRQEGFFQAEVTPETQVDQVHQIANVTFHVKLNRAAKFGTIQIANATPEEAAKLTKSLQTLVARARGAAVREGKAYHHSNITKANQYLQAQLNKQGRLAAQVKLAGAEYHSDTNRADIHFDVNTGPLIHVKIEGARLFPWTRTSLLPFYQGIGVDEESVQEGRQALTSYFQAKGFFNVKVDAQVNTQTSGEVVTYKINKDKKHKVASVSIAGNQHMSTGDLEARLTVQKHQFFSPGKYSDQLVRSSVKNLTAIYQSEGYSTVKVTPTVANRGGDITVAFQVAEGPRDIVSSFAIEGADTFAQSKFAPQGLKLAAGQPYSQAHVEADRASIVAHYLEAGYLTSSFRETATVPDKKDPHHISVVYHIYEGPLVHAGDVVTLGRAKTQQRLIDTDMALIKANQPLTETQLLTSESRLYDHTGVFDWAEVDPRRQITTQTKEDVLVKLHEAKKNTMTYGFGFEIINRGGSIPSGTVALPNLPPVGLPTGYKTDQATFYGPRGTFQYTRNNFRGKGESLSFTGFAGRLDQRAAAYYIDPNFRWTKWKGTTSLSYEKNEENPIYSSRQELASLQFQRAIGAAKADNTLFLRYSFSKTNLTRVLIPDLVPTADQNVRLSTLGANFTHDTRDNALDEHKGMLDSAELDFNTTKLGSSVNFTKFNGQAAYYKQGFHNIVFANSLRIGLAQQYDNSRVPLSEEFFTGGGNSLRGFPLDGAGPQRAVEVCSTGEVPPCPQINVSAGGNELLLINSEARIPLPIKQGLGIVAFYDGGNVFPRVGFHDFSSLYTNNVGIGLRYATPVGPVRIDLGRNLNPVTGITPTQYFISIGQAF